MIHEGRRTLSQGSFEENQRNIQIPQRSVQDEDLWNTLIFLRQEIVTKFPAKRPKVFPEKTEGAELEKIKNNTIGIGTLSLAITETSFHYNLRSTSIIKTETMDDNFSDSSGELSLVILEDIEIDLEDFQGATFEDALKSIEEKNQPAKVINWPNNAYRDFMKLIIDGNVSNKIGNQIIKFFNTYSNLKNFPLPKSTKSGKDYLN